MLANPLAAAGYYNNFSLEHEYLQKVRVSLTANIAIHRVIQRRDVNEIKFRMTTIG
jgi:hypothetical protein